MALHLQSVFYFGIALCASFFFGTLVGTNSENGMNMNYVAPCEESGKEALINDIIQERVMKNLKTLDTIDGTAMRFGLGNAAVTGAVKTKKMKFSQSFDYGVNAEPGPNDNMLIFYRGLDALPSDEKVIKQSISYGDGDGIPEVVDPEVATENCDFMNVFMMPNRVKNSCLAIVDDYESSHVQTWMRDTGSSLKPVNRGRQKDGKGNIRIGDSRSSQDKVKQYLNSLDEVLAELRPIAEKVAINNTIIVLTCNFGQSSLLVNFVCAAKSRGLDTSNIIVFPTDEETLNIAKGLGLAAFYDEKNFGFISKQESRSYGGIIFKQMMHAKLVSVQLINMLGYDVLFQDVDMVWYKNPLTLFHDKSNPLYDFDVMFQDDGARSARYAPYSANSGFYYVRYNARTRYLFTSMLYSSQIIDSSGSHQQALIYALVDQASLFGLKVKVLSRDEPDFPGGWHYHRRKDLMKDIALGKQTPYIFHMSWTLNKDDKVQYMRQMGMWFLEEKCFDKEIPEIFLGPGNDGGYANKCCSVDPLITCYFRDKPSIVPCKESDPKDKGRGSFW